MKIKTVTFSSNAMWYAPGMIENYKRARNLRVPDKDMIDLFEGAYPDCKKIVFDAIALGNYEVEGETVYVSFLITEQQFCDNLAQEE